jgi:hypothetical protein
VNNSLVVSRWWCSKYVAVKMQVEVTTGWSLVLAERSSAFACALLGLKTFDRLAISTLCFHTLCANSGRKSLLGLRVEYIVQRRQSLWTNQPFMPTLMHGTPSGIASTLLVLTWWSDFPRSFPGDPPLSVTLPQSGLASLFTPLLV